MTLPSGKTGLALTGAALVVLVAAAYHAILWNGFLAWDDDLLITGNPFVTGGLTFAGIAAAFTRFDPQLYIPFTFLSYQFTVTLFGLQPWVFHLSNLLLHAGNVLLVWWVLELLTRNRTAAIMTALLFALHPLHTETVAWASSRKDLLSSFFFLVSVGCYLLSERRTNRRWYVLSILAFAAGLLSKVSIVILPFALLLIDWFQGKKITGERIVRLVPYFALSIAAGIIASFGKASAGWFLYEKVLIACKAIIFYLQKLILPTGLSTVYPYTQSISLFTPDIFVSVALVIAISIFVWRLRSVRMLPFVWVWFLLLLLPSFATIAKGYNELLDVYFASDRYVYLASVAPLLLVSLFAAELLRTARVPVLCVFGCVLVLLGYGTYRQTLVWRDTETLFRHALASYPDAHIAHTNLGAVLYKKGDVEGAIREFEATLAIRSDTMAYNNLAAIAYERGKIPEALEYYRKAIETGPGDLDAHINLGGILADQGRYAEAVPVLQEAVELNPESRHALINLGLALEGVGDLKGALEIFIQAQTLFPDDEDIRATVMDISQRVNAMEKK